MPTYDPTGHARLSAAAVALGAEDPEKLAAYADEAEAGHGIAGTSYTGADADALTLAMALQVNRIVAREGYGGGLLSSESKGDQSYTLARDARTGAVEWVDPVAAQIVQRVTAPTWAVAGSLR